MLQNTFWLSIWGLLRIREPAWIGTICFLTMLRLGCWLTPYIIFWDFHDQNYIHYTLPNRQQREQILLDVNVSVNQTGLTAECCFDVTQYLFVFFHVDGNDCQVITYPELNASCLLKLLPSPPFCQGENRKKVGN